jgi:hypothetical protein
MWVHLLYFIFLPLFKRCQSRKYIGGHGGIQMNFDMQLLICDFLLVPDEPVVCRRERLPSPPLSEFDFFRDIKQEIDRFINLVKLDVSRSCESYVTFCL